MIPNSMQYGNIYIIQASMTQVYEYNYDRVSPEYHFNWYLKKLL